MIPDLGKYTIWVLGAYGISLALIAVLLLATIRRGLRVRAALREVEGRQGARDAG